MILPKKIVNTGDAMFYLKIILIVTIILFNDVLAKPKQFALGVITVDGIDFTNMKDAETAIKDYSQVYFSQGTFNQGIHITKDNVVLSGQKGTKFISAVVQGKGTFVVSGANVVIENIECSGVSVGSNNGACIRHQGKDLTVQGVYFHSSQQGILTTSDSGYLNVRYSRFENLGKAGRAHAIYANGAVLSIKSSTIINSVDSGHEIKSRATKTIISDSTIGSIDTNDSRTIDIPNGGELVILNSVIFQGRNTVNRQLIGYGHEGIKKGRTNIIDLKNNIFILERKRGNEFFAKAKTKQIININISDNAIIGQPIIDIKEYEATNKYYKSKADANLIATEIPNIAVLPYLMMN